MPVDVIKDLPKLAAEAGRIIRRDGTPWPFDMPPAVKLALVGVMSPFPPEKQREILRTLKWLNETAKAGVVALGLSEREVSMTWAKRLKGAHGNRRRAEEWEAALLDAQLALSLSLRQKPKRMQLAEIRNPQGPHAAAARKCLVGIKLPADRWCLPVLQPRLKKIGQD